MRLVRVDALARGGHPLELHPSLTVLLGAGPEQRRRLEEVVAALGGSGRLPADAATVDLHGVVVPLDPAIVTMLRTVPPLAPLLQPVPSSVPPARPAGDGAGGADADPRGVRTGSGPDDGLWSPSGAAPAAPEVDDHRRALEARLDPVADAEVAAALAHLDVVAAQEVEQSAERERRRIDGVARRGHLLVAVDEVHGELAGLRGRDPAPVQAAHDALQTVRSTPGGPDPEAEQLADALELLEVEREVVAARRAEVESALVVAESAVVETRAQLDQAEREHRAPTHDPVLVRRLEEVRDRLFAVAARPSGDDDLDDLRAEEAEVLDALGYETYTAYVAGVPNADALAARTEAVEAARAALDAATAEVLRLRAGLPDGGLTDELDAAHRDLVVRAVARLGAVEGAPVVGPGPSGPLPETAAARTAVLVPALRALQRPVPSDDDPVVVTATAGLREALAVVGAEVGWARLPTEVLAVADLWLERHVDLPAQIDATAARASELEAELAEVESELTRAEDVEVELAAAVRTDAEERLAAAERRRTAHDEVVAEIAALDALERTLAEAARRGLVAGAVPANTSAPWRRAAWQVTCAVGRRRATTVGGSVPVLVDADGGSVPAAERAEVLARLAALAPVVQTVVLTDDPAVAVWAESLGPHLARAVRC